MSIFKSTASLVSLLFAVFTTTWAKKPPLTLDEFFNAVDIRSVQISPDGHAVVIETMRPDWAARRFRNDLWLYRNDSGGSLVQLTQSGHDSSPQWSPDGHWIAFLSDRKTAAESNASDDTHTNKAENVTQIYLISPYGGREFPVTFGEEEIHAFAHEPYGIFAADLPGGMLHLAIHFQDRADEIQWAADSRHVFFIYEAGAPEGPFEEQTQTRLYWVDKADGRAVRWASRFTGEFGRSLGAFAVVRDGGILATGQLGTEVQPYTESSTDAEFVKQSGWPGTYEMLSAARRSPRVAFVYSSLQRPREVYLAEGPNHLDQAKAVTAFNRLFTERELPQGKPYRWTADDGTHIDGMLIYPPGKFGAKHLPTFTWIHGGPKFADGNALYGPGVSDLEALAATQGWLVLQPNYRGSTGYGDAFTRGMVLHVNSRPGKDILEGVDALVKDGIADPDQLALGGYSSGGDLTNWLITQTTRFKAAVTGAGVVDWVAAWGNDGQSLYDEYLLGGVPWEAEANYHAESSAIWQIGKVTTPTQIVIGSEDGLVEQYLLERALYARGVPHSLLIFPGEAHSFKNPWHAKIAVREELKWLEKYGRKSL